MGLCSFSACAEVRDAKEAVWRLQLSEECLWWLDQRWCARTLLGRTHPYGSGGLVYCFDGILPRKKAWQPRKGDFPGFSLVFKSFELHLIFEKTSYSIFFTPTCSMEQWIRACDTTTLLPEVLIIPWTNKAGITKRLEKTLDVVWRWVEAFWTVRPTVCFREFSWGCYLSFQRSIWAVPVSPKPVGQW